MWNPHCEQTIGLLRWPEVLVEPIQGFLDQLVARDVVPGVIDQMLFLILAATEQAEKRFLGGIHWEEEVVAPVEHDRGLFHVRKEVDDMHFWQPLLQIKASQTW